LSANVVNKQDVKLKDMLLKFLFVCPSLSTLVHVVHPFGLLFSYQITHHTVKDPTVMSMSEPLTLYISNATVLFVNDECSVLDKKFGMKYAKFRVANLI